MRMVCSWSCVAIWFFFAAAYDPHGLEELPTRELGQEHLDDDTCETCLSKGGGWCTIEGRCVEDDASHCDLDHLIGLAGFSNDCGKDPTKTQKKRRDVLEKGVLVSYVYETGACCMGIGVIHRAYKVLEEYTVLLRDGSKEEVKTERWNNRKPPKKSDENSEYHNMEFRYFKPHELTVVSSIRPGDSVQTHFAVKHKGDPAELIMSQRVEEAVVINTSITTVAVNFTSDHIVSIVPRHFVIDPTNNTARKEPIHDEL
mmetsp:Transcript_54208/g.121534  ORF Transcript_54208/g.121534 Transcript_54208/m.121534 type:complete len:257 (-) Transcript_54208:13-783(-)